MAWNADGTPDRSPKVGHWAEVNPRALRPQHRVDRNERDRVAIRHYERHPHAAQDGGYPWVQRGMFGGWSALQNGHHRRQAAINRGRRLRIWVRY